MFLTMKCRLMPSRAKRDRLVSLIDDQRVLYNAALEERIGCFRKTGRSVTCFDQCKALTECRRDIPEMRDVPAQLQRGTLKRLDEAFKGFFRRVRNGERPGFPRFKGRGWFDTLEFAEFSGVTFDGKHLRSKAFGSIRVHVHRPLQGRIRAAKIMRDGRNWHVCLQVEVEAAPEERRAVSRGSRRRPDQTCHPEHRREHPDAPGGEGTAAQATAHGAMQEGVRRQAQRA